MNQKSKIESYQKIYGYLKNMEGVSELDYPKQKENLDFSCFVGDIKILYSLSAKMDILSVRGELHTDKMTDEEIINQAAAISKNYSGMMSSGYDNHMIFMIHMPCGGLGDDAAKKLLFDKTVEFITYMRDVVMPMGYAIHHPDHKEVSTAEIKDENINNDSSLEDEPYAEGITMAEDEKAEMISGFNEKPVDEEDLEKDTPDIGDTDKKLDIIEVDAESDTPYDDVENMVSNSDAVDAKESGIGSGILDSDANTSDNPISKNFFDRTAATPNKFVGSMAGPGRLFETKSDITDTLPDDSYLEETFRIKTEQLDFRETLLNRQMILIEQEKKELEKEKNVIKQEKESLKAEKETFETQKKDVIQQIKCCLKSQIKYCF